MKCEEIMRFASLYLDGEFDDSERALFEQHLSECSSCKEDVNGLLVFQTAFRKRAGQIRMPEETRARMTALVHERAGASARRNRFILAASAAAAIVLVVGGILLYQPWAATDPLARLVDESIAAHEASLPPEVQGDGETIRGYLARHDEGPVEPPLQEDDKTQLVGVRLTRFGKDRAILYRYLHQGRDISVLQVPRRLSHADALPRPSQRETSRVVYRGARNGHNVTTFESPRYTNTVVGDIPEPDMLRLVPASL